MPKIGSYDSYSDDVLLKELEKINNVIKDTSILVHRYNLLFQAKNEVIIELKRRGYQM